MRNIRAGALRTPVFLGKPVVAKDAAGGETLTWAEFKTWALIEPLGGRESLGSGSVKDTVDCRITLRVTPAWIPSARWRVRDPQTARIYDLVTAMLVDKTAAVECLGKLQGAVSDGR